MENIKIRNATLEDIESVAKLHVDSWHETYAGIISQDYLDNMKNNLEKRIQRMKNEFNLRTMIVVTLNDEIVGFSEFVFSNEFSKDLDIDCELCGLYIKNGYKQFDLVELDEDVTDDEEVELTFGNMNGLKRNFNKKLRELKYYYVDNKFILSFFWETIETNKMESQRLAQLRDALLPKLMSGEIDVSEVEI